MIVVIVLSLIMGIVGWLLFAPIFIRIDSERSDFSIQWWSFGRVKLMILENEFLIRILWWFGKKDIYPFRAKRVKKVRPKKAKSKATKKRSRFFLKKLPRLLRTFRIRQFKVELDTDDYVINAYLYPIFYLLNRPYRQMSVNFEGRTNVSLYIENCLFNVIRAFIL